MFGIDVYSGDGAVDWAAVASSGKSFAFAKATEGRTIKDDKFATHWPAMRAAGLLRGAYHFFYAVSSSPDDQANALLETMGPLVPGDLPPVIDVEEASLQGAVAETVLAGIARWLAVVEAKLLAQTGKPLRPFIYTNADTWTQLGNDDRFSGHPLWIANDGVSAPQVPPPWAGGGALVWQYAENVGGITGVSGQADLDQDRPVGVGSQGNFVAQVQQLLTNLQEGEFDPGGVDGDYGPLTTTAVRNFQTANGLQQDGIVGLRTWAALIWA